MTKELDKVYDVIVIGAGPGGMTAALYASRANLSTLLLEKGAPGGEMLNTADIENYPGFKSIAGYELADKMYEGAMSFDAEHQFADVTGISDEGDIKIVHTSKADYKSKTVIIATGASHRQLGIRGEEEYQGKGVSYCAVCDGNFFRKKNVVVIGGGDSAVEEGTYLSQLADSVTIVHRRDQLRAQAVLQQRAFEKENVHFLYDTVPLEILGDTHRVTGLRLQNVKTKEESELAIDGVFIYVGVIPVSEAFTSLGITNEQGWIKTDDHMQTSRPGIFAIGDVREKHLRQIATAVGDGAIAGQAVYQYIEAQGDLK